MAYKKKEDNIDPKTCHAGHRQRLLNRITEFGTEAFSDIEMCEFALTYCLPRVNTNLIAHRILTRYGTLARAMDASVHDLADNIIGLSVTSAKKLRALVDVFYAYQAEKINTNAQCDYVGACKFMHDMLSSRSHEAVCMLAINKRKQIITYQIVENDSVKTTGLSAKRFSDFLQSSNPWQVAIGHNHPGGTCEPSQKDVASTERLEHLANGVDVALLDSFVVADDGIFSISGGMAVADKDGNILKNGDVERICSMRG